MDSSNKTPIKTYNCAIEATLDMIGGRWKALILFQLLEYGTQRFSQLHRAIPGITEKMLTAQLRKLADDALISREVYPVVPPKVEYSLTSRGVSMAPLLYGMRAWGEEHTDGRFIFLSPS